MASLTAATPSLLVLALCLALSSVAPLNVFAQGVDPFISSQSPQGSSVAYSPDIAYNIAYESAQAPTPAVYYFSGGGGTTRGSGGGALPPGAVEEGGGGSVGDSPDIPIVVIDDGGFLPGPTSSAGGGGIADAPDVEEEAADVPAEESSSPPPPPSVVIPVVTPGGGSASAPAPAPVENDGEEQAAAIEAFLKDKKNGYARLYAALKGIGFFATLASGIDNGNSYTIIAPVDKGFKKFKIGKKLKIADVLAGHVITAGKLKYDAVFSAAADTALNTLLGTKVFKGAKLKRVKKVLRPRLLTKKANGKRRSVATVIVPDAFETTNVVVHGISKVLRPSSA